MYTKQEKSDLTNSLRRDSHYAPNSGYNIGSAIPPRIFFIPSPMLPHAKAFGVRLFPVHVIGRRFPHGSSQPAIPYSPF